MLYFNCWFNCGVYACVDYLFNDLQSFHRFKRAKGGSATHRLAELTRREIWRMEITRFSPSWVSRCFGVKPRCCVPIGKYIWVPLRGQSNMVIMWRGSLGTHSHFHRHFFAKTSSISPKKFFHTSAMDTLSESYVTVLAILFLLVKVYHTERRTRRISRAGETDS